MQHVARSVYASFEGRNRRTADRDAFPPIVATPMLVVALALVRGIAKSAIYDRAVSQFLSPHFFCRHEFPRSARVSSPSIHCPCSCWSVWICCVAFPIVSVRPVACRVCFYLVKDKTGRADVRRIFSLPFAHRPCSLHRVRLKRTARAELAPVPASSACAALKPTCLAPPLPSRAFCPFPKVCFANA